MQIFSQKYYKQHTAKQPGNDYKAQTQNRHPERNHKNHETNRQNNKIPHLLADIMREHLTKNNLLMFMSLMAFLFSICFGFMGSYHAMLLMGIISVAFLFFANLERISKLKFGKTGFEAETREVVRVARSTIKELRDLSKIMAASILGLVKRTGRFGGYSYDEKEHIKGQTVDVLMGLGIKNQEIEQVIEASKWYKYVEFDFVHDISGGSKIPECLPQQYIPEWKELRSGGIDNNLTPDELTEAIARWGLLTEEGKELIEDYRHYINTRVTVHSNSG